MNRTIRLAGEPLVGETEAVIELSQTMVAALALELSLLLAGLASGLRLRAQSGSSIGITVGGRVAVSKAVVRRGAGDAVSFELGRNQAEYPHTVLLRAYCDGVAEVDHVHVEGIQGNEDFALTVMFELYREPMTGEEAMRLMDE